MSYTFEQRKRAVELYNAGKPISEIMSENDLSRSTVRRWITRINETGSSRAADNTAIGELLEVFGIKRSLSKKGCPFDNAAYESTNKILKAKFVYQERFSTLYGLQVKLSDYVHWYNNFRLHSTLGYLSPFEFREAGLTL